MKMSNAKDLIEMIEAEEIEESETFLNEMNDDDLLEMLADIAEGI